MRSTGGIHSGEDQAAHDLERQRLLELTGVTFVRVRAELVERDLPAALDAIRAALNASLPSLAPSREKGRG